MRAYLINRADRRHPRHDIPADDVRRVREDHPRDGGKRRGADAGCLPPVYRGLLEAYFGPDFTLDAELEIECLRIPHFYSAFYVYKYATGISAAVSLAQKVLAGGRGEMEVYLGFLKSGGSSFPLPTLAKAGVDMSAPEPVERTLRLFEQRVRELEELLV